MFEINYLKLCVIEKIKHGKRLVLILKIIIINLKGLLQVDFFYRESSSLNKFCRDALFSRRVRVYPGGILAGLCLSA